MKFKCSKINDYSKTTTIELSELKDVAEFIKNNQWSGGVFKNSTRNNENFESADLIALDIDEGLTIESAKSILDEKNLSYIIGTTKSHGISKNGKVACDRFRVIIPFAERIKSKNEFDEIMKAIISEFPQIDKNAKDCARFFYPCKEVVHTNFSGELLLKNIHFKNEEKSTAINGIPKKGNLSFQTNKFLQHGAAPGSWNANIFKSAKDMQEQGYSKKEAFGLFEQMNNQFYSGTLDSSDIASIESAFKNPPKYEPRNINYGDFSFAYSAKKDPQKLMNIIEEMFGYYIWYNEAKGRIYLNENPINDDDDAEIRTKLRTINFNFDDKFVSDTVRVLSRINKKHPFKEFVQYIKWDNHDYINDLFNTIEVDEENIENIPLYKKYLKNFLIGLIARVYKPGSQNLVLTLKGPQGASKSRWLARFDLVTGCYAEGPINPENKDDKLRHISQVIHHITELDATTKRDVNALKAFLTMDFISERKSYDRHNTDGKSQLSFVASVNSNDFLRDTTGNRRFLVIPVKKMNADHEVDMQQVLAQAYDLYLSGERYWFNEGEIEKINSINEDYMPEQYHKDICARISPNEGEHSKFLSYHEIIEELKVNPRIRFSDSAVRKYLRELKNSKGEPIKKRDRTNSQDILKYNVKLNPFQNSQGGS